MSLPDLSIILPGFNAREAAVAAVARLRAVVAFLPFETEIIVVDDGSRPEDATRSSDIKGEARVIALPENRGKGAAVRAGMLAASGRLRLFTDIDLPYDLAAIGYAVSLMDTGCVDLIAGDRAHPLSTMAAKIPTHRRSLSRIFTTVTSSLLLHGVSDTQCGFKMFRGDLAQSIFENLTTSRFAFDVEVFILASRLNARTTFIPVRLIANDASTIRLLKDGASMLGDLARMLANHGLSHQLTPPSAALPESLAYWDVPSPAALKKAQ